MYMFVQWSKKYQTRDAFADVDRMLKKIQLRKLNWTSNDNICITSHKKKIED